MKHGHYSDNVSWCWTCAVSDTDTYNYTELCNFCQIINGVGVSVSVFVSVLHRVKLIRPVLSNNGVKSL